MLEKLWSMLGGLTQPSFLPALQRGVQPAPAASPRPPPTPTDPARQFRAVTITAQAECCESVRRFHGRRILTTNAPFLPLKDCSSPENCACRYRKFADRRAKYERRQRVVGWVQANNADRRLRKGRRVTDH